MSYARVVWGEGTLISPQHFQQQERYFDTLINKNYTSNQYYHWGFQELIFNTSANQVGILEIAKVRGFFKDGTYFEETSSSSPNLKIAIPPNLESEIIYLAWSGRSEYLNNFAAINSVNEYVGQYLVYNKYGAARCH